MEVRIGMWPRLLACFIAFAFVGVAPRSPGVVVLPNHSTAYDSVFGHIIYGEVSNRTGDEIAAIRVTATRPNGETSSTFVKIGRLKPGESGCFALYTQSAQPWDDAKLSVSSMKSARPRPNLFPVLVATIVTQGDDPAIVGTARNENRALVRAATVVGTLYDVDERVIGCERSSVQPPTVPPNGVVSYSVLFTQRTEALVYGFILAFGGESRE